MKVDENGRLAGVRQVISPNCDERPAGCRPSLIVVHAISLPPGCYGGPFIDSLFTNRLDPAAHPYFAEICELKVSAHVLVRRDGELVQYVPFGQRAWHAGQSCYAGREACNDFSIGIELEGDDDTPFNAAQYRRLAALCGTLQRHYPDIGSNIAGHCDVAPGRKTDPGPHFDWDLLQALVAADHRRAMLG